MVEAEDLERAHDLLAVVRERAEVGAFVVIPEECVEHLFHVAQVGLDLARHLGEQQPLLGAARHLVEHRCRGMRCRLSGVEPGDHRVDLIGHIRREVGEVLDQRFGQQQARRIVHRRGLGDGAAGQLVQATGQGGGEF